MKKILLPLLCMTILGTCDKLDVPARTPDCIKEAIQGNGDLARDYAPVRVWKYSLNNETYYSLDADCCDRFNPLVDEDCNYICAPSGGFTGAGDGQCPEWVENIDFSQGELIWERE